MARDEQEVLQKALFFIMEKAEVTKAFSYSLSTGGEGFISLPMLKGVVRPSDH